MITIENDSNFTPEWFLVASKPKQESRAVENLKNQSITAYAPQLKVEKIVKGRRKVVVEPMFTGYLFVQISKNDPNWHRVRSTRGVRDWVRFSGEPARLPDNIVDSLLLSEKGAGDQIKTLMEIGEKVRVESGPFQGLEGIFESADGDLRSFILIEFLGKKSRISIENEQISSN